MPLKTTVRLNTITQPAYRPSVPKMKFGRHEGKFFCEIKEEYLYSLLQSSEELVLELRCYFGLPTDQLTTDEFKRRLLNALSRELKATDLTTTERKLLTSIIQKILVQL